MSSAGPSTGLFRALLVLGRVSNVPTVWSNCLAGWLLGGDGDFRQLLWLCLGATLLYVGGMYLNDACDVEFDRQFRRERPIPSGAIGVGAVWGIGVGMLAGGVFVLAALGPATRDFTFALAALIVIYDATHKRTCFAPLLMAGCRFMLYLVAASVGEQARVFGVNGATLWCALALASYVTGLSFIARVESAPGAVARWPLLLAGTPVALVLLQNDGAYQRAGWALAVLLTAWVMRCVRQLRATDDGRIGRAVSGLLAGIVLVDLAAVGALAAVGGVRWELLATFPMMFLAALAFQRVVPAT